VLRLLLVGPLMLLVHMRGAGVDLETAGAVLGCKSRWVAVAVCAHARCGRGPRDGGHMLRLLLVGFLLLLLHMRGAGVGLLPQLLVAFVPRASRCAGLLMGPWTRPERPSLKLRAFDIDH
jgi:hypothetical protein